MAEAPPPPPCAVTVVMPVPEIVVLPPLPPAPPVFSTFVIVAFANAVNITDGLDGLAGGIMMIAVTAFWIIARTIIDVPTSIFIAVWLGGMIAFLYFNIYPARLFLGDTGALSFGATFAVIGLILGKAFALPIIGAIFVLEIFSSLIQLLGKKFLKRKLLPHHGRN